MLYLAASFSFILLPSPKNGLTLAFHFHAILSLLSSKTPPSHFHTLTNSANRGNLLIFSSGLSTSSL
jgi:hypothetical protein